MPMNRADETRNRCSCFLCNFTELEEEQSSKSCIYDFKGSELLPVGCRKGKPVLRHYNVDRPIHHQPHSQINGHEGGERSDLHGCRSGKLAVSFAAHTAKQQLVNGSVSVRKKRRSTVEEVDEPDLVAGQADRLISKSVFRKAAHAQDFDKARSGITNPTRLNPFQQ